MSWRVSVTFNAVTGHTDVRTETPVDEVQLAPRIARPKAPPANQPTSAQSPFRKLCRRIRMLDR